MDLTDRADHPAPAMMPFDDDDAALRPHDPGFVGVIRLRLLFTMVPLLIGVVLVDGLVLRSQELPWGWLSVLAVLMAAIVVVVVPRRRFERMGHALHADRLRTVVGYVFHRDTVVPFSRVQHIDVTQGPIERSHGVATLVVHTAGTHNSVVAVEGLARADAEAIRDTIRREIRAEPQ